jgi:3-oxoacyl-[acyl-carrier-protein] synthase-3
MCPANACLIQAALGCRHIPAFDISAACSGFLYALSVASQYVRTGAAKHALVVGAEVLTRAIDLTDRNAWLTGISENLEPPPLRDQPHPLPR